jgi:hypothetical protein
MTCARGDIAPSPFGLGCLILKPLYQMLKLFFAQSLVHFYRLERSYGSFQRTIPLPVEIEADKIEAKFKKGVLIVNLPKTAEAQKQAKRIAVKTS